MRASEPALAEPKEGCAAEPALAEYCLPQLRHKGGPKARRGVRQSLHWLNPRRGVRQSLHSQLA